MNSTQARLSDLGLGEQGSIMEIHGDDAISVRLMEMGLIEGEPIQLISIAPLGDPLEFLIRGYRLSLRRDEANRVSIERVRSTS